MIKWLTSERPFVVESMKGDGLVLGILAPPGNIIFGGVVGRINTPTWVDLRGAAVLDEICQVLRAGGLPFDPTTLFPQARACIAWCTFKGLRISLMFAGVPLVGDLGEGVDGELQVGIGKVTNRRDGRFSFRFSTQAVEPNEAEIAIWQQLETGIRQAISELGFVLKYDKRP